MLLFLEVCGHVYLSSTGLLWTSVSVSTQKCPDTAFEHHFQELWVELRLLFVGSQSDVKKRILKTKMPRGGRRKEQCGVFSTTSTGHKRST